MGWDIQRSTGNVVKHGTFSDSLRGGKRRAESSLMISGADEYKNRAQHFVA